MDRIDSLCFAAPRCFHLTRFFFSLESLWPDRRFNDHCRTLYLWHLEILVYPLSSVAKNQFVPSTDSLHLPSRMVCPARFHMPPVPLPLLLFSSGHAIGVRRDGDRRVHQHCIRAQFHRLSRMTRRTNARIHHHRHCGLLNDDADLVARLDAPVGPDRRAQRHHRCTTHFLQALRQDRIGIDIGQNRKTLLSPKFRLSKVSIDPAADSAVRMDSSFTHLTLPPPPAGPDAPPPPHSSPRSCCSSRYLSCP